MKTVLSYKDWLANKLVADTETRSHTDYLKYVNEQYKTLESTADLTDTNSEYVQFTRDLTELFSVDSELSKYISNVDLNNPKHYRNAIPHFASSLKKISEYIGNKRKDPKSLASAYTTIDSIESLKQSVIDNILSKYGSNGISIDSERLQALSGIDASIVELYDDTNYFDKSPNMVPSDYFDISGDNAEYVKLFGVSADAVDWSIKTGFNPNVQTGSDGQLLLEKYLGNDLFSLGGSDGYTLNTDAKNHTGNILNKYYPTIAISPLVGGLYNASDVGDFMLPHNLGISIYHGKNRAFDPLNVQSVSDTSKFLSPELYSDGVGGTNEYQDSPIAYNPTLNWMDIRYYTKSGRGMVGDSKQFQEMIPYKTDYEIAGRSDIGISRLIENLDPWTGPKDDIWAQTKTDNDDFRIIYDIVGWENALVLITGNEYSWGIDVFGNNWALYKPSRPYNLYDFKNLSKGELYIRGIDGYIIPFSQLFKGKFFFDSLLGITQYWNDNDVFGGVGNSNFDDFGITDIKEMQVYNDTLIVVDSDDKCVVQNITMTDSGNMQFKGNLGYNFKYEVKRENGEQIPDDYLYFDHFYDNRSNTLYVVRYKTLEKAIHFKLYSWKDGKIDKILDTYSNSIDTYEFDDNIKNINGTVMDLNAERNELIFSTIITTVGLEKYIVGYVYKILHGAVDNLDLISVKLGDICEGGTSVGKETKNLLDINYFDNKLLFILEGERTNNKYLQILEV